MTAFSDVDLDRLADFVGGALDGTPDADDVRHLVSTDTNWAQAYAQLVTADAAVRDELAGLGAEHLEVPPDVLQRLDAALAGAATRPTADAAVFDLQSARAARNRRRQRWAVGLGVAAAVLGCGVLGVRMLPFGSAGSGRSASGVADQPQRAQPDQATQEAGGTVSGGTVAPGPAAIVVTGKDYSRATVGELAQTTPGPTRALKDNSSSDAAKGAATDVTGPLQRLGDPVARAACLTAIVEEYGGKVALVDFARFEGKPALVVVVDGARAAAGRHWVVAVGPTCGLNGAIADELYHAAVA